MAHLLQISKTKMAPAVVDENHRSYEITIFGSDSFQAFLAFSIREVFPGDGRETNFKNMEGFQVKRVEDIPWYHDLNRNGAEAMLLAYGSQGSYLIRPSKNNPGHYAVSVRSLDSVKHFSLICNNGKLAFGVGEFSNVKQLMEHFQNYPIIGGETGPPITLAHPYSSKIPEPPIYDDISRHVVCGKSDSTDHNSSTCTSGSTEEDSHDIDWSIASKEGFLTKQGAIHKNWKRRWFVTNRNTLKYYNERGDKKPLRVLDLRLAEEAFRNNKCGKPNAFSLVFPFRTFFLFADSEAEMQEWIDLLTWKLDKVKCKRHSVTV